MIFLGNKYGAKARMPNKEVNLSPPPDGVKCAVCGGLFGESLVVTHFVDRPDPVWHHVKCSVDFMAGKPN